MSVYRLIRYGFWSVAAIAGIFIVLRTLLDPSSFPFSAKSPMNAEGCFGLAIITALAARANARDEKTEPHKPTPARLMVLGALALGLLTAAAFWRALHFYFLSDDFVLVKAGNSSLGDLGAFFVGESGYGFYRPIAKLSLALNSTWAAWHPPAWHASALLIHFANSYLVFLLALRLSVSPFAAFFAAALFSIHGTRPETAVWIAGRFDVLATLFVLCGLLLFPPSLSAPKVRGNLYLAASLACMVLGILSKESAYAFPMLLVLALVTEQNLPRKRIGAVALFFLVAAGLMALRWILLGGIGGYRQFDTGQAKALTISVVAASKVLLLRLWAVLFFPVNWSIRPGVMFAVLMAVYLISLVWLALRRTDRRRLTFALGFVVLASLPPLHLLLIGGDLEKSRFLYLPSAGFCLLLALASERLIGRARWIVPGVMLAFNLCALEHNLDAWEHASAKAESACAEAVNCLDSSTRKIVVAGLPPILGGVYFFGNGFPECVEMRRGGNSIPVELQPGSQPRAQGDGVRRLWWDPARQELRCMDPR